MTEGGVTEGGVTEGGVDPCANIFCDDHLACTEDLCENGKCVHPIKEGFCRIGGVCFDDGHKKDDASCHRCDASVSKTAWTDDPSLCDDDGVPCTQSKCKAGTCSQQIDPGHCLVAGTCHVDGASDPGNECKVCDSVTSQTAFKDRPDGAPCTADPLPCTDDLCQAGACSHPVKPDHCLIDSTCYTAGQPDPQADCQICDPAASTSSWTGVNSGPCTDDGLGCTDDLCAGGACTHPVKGGWCLIAGTCHAAGASNPASECEACDPAQSTQAWTAVPNGTPCPDALTCTEDLCISGQCVHDVMANTCLVAGICYNSGDIVDGNACTMCLPGQSTTSGTFVEGKACDDGDASNFADICRQSTCKGFTGMTWAVDITSTEAAMNGVAFMPSSGQVWAVGRIAPGGVPTGFLVRLNGPAATDLWTGGSPLNSIHGQMAVGDSGTAAYYNGVGWITATDAATHMAGVKVNGVWSANLAGGIRSFYLAADSSRLAYCETPDNGATFGCLDHSGFDGNTVRVFGTLNGASQGPLWAVRGDMYEDIYYKAASGTAWSTSSPLGCYDVPGVPCGDTSGRFLDLWATGPSDVWAVGEAGLVMRYDGNGWQKVAIPTLTSPVQDAYNFRAVFAHGDLVMLAGDRNYNNQYHEMVVLFYNRKLGMWFPPQGTYWTYWADPLKDTYRFRDIGGPDLGNIYLVGSLWSATTGQQRALFMYSN